MMGTYTSSYVHLSVIFNSETTRVTKVIGKVSAKRVKTRTDNPDRMSGSKIRGDNYQATTYMRYEDG